MSACYPTPQQGAVFNNNIVSSGASAGNKATFGVATREVHYQATPGAVTPVAIDDPQSTSALTLPNRVAMEFYNAGTQTIEVSLNSNFKFGDGTGRPIPAGAAWFITIAPSATTGQKHYALAQSGTGDLRITELGA